MESVWGNIFDRSPAAVFDRAKREALTIRSAGRYAESPGALMQAAGMEPDAWQRDLLRSEWNRALLLCCRQAGKSTATGALALHQSIKAPGSEVIIVSPSNKQSSELLRRTMEIYRDAAPPVKAEAESQTRIVFDNGSRILSLPGTPRAVRGYTADLLIIDEAAFVIDEVFHAADPMLAVSGGRLIALSTPFGKRGWFWHEWTSATAWHRTTVTAPECPRISAEFLEEKRRTMPPHVFASEYLCEFGDTVESFFRSQDLDAMFTDEIRPLFEPDPDTIAAGLNQSVEVLDL
jgi:hypothetical protein